MADINTSNNIEFKIGYWYPDKNGYYNKCKHCPNYFFGRKNRKFCPPPNKCKINHNNWLAAERVKDYAPFTKIAQKNLAILKSIWSIGRQSATMTELFQLGFNSTGPSTLIKHNSFEGEWYKVGTFIYQVDLKTQIVKFFNTI